MRAQKLKVPGFGLIIIGTEILSGARSDAHFKNALKLLGRFGYPLRYSIVIPDDPKIIVSQLKWGMSRPEAFFCFGGIGATPDDHTRQCAAKAAGLPLKRHPEAVRVIEQMYGAGAYPIRIRMAELPIPSTLIPNPITQVAGFSVGKHHFLPGFPQMAKPMMQWVLKNLYGKRSKEVTFALSVKRGSESDMVPLMEKFVQQHPSVYFFSLPSIKNKNEEYVQLGVTGLKREAAKAFGDLTRSLDKNNFCWEKEK